MNDKLTGQKKRYVIVGYGAIGTELSQILNSMGWEFVGYVNSKGTFSSNSSELDYKTLLTGCDFVFICLPSSDSKRNYSFIRQALDEGVCVVTCEKAALFDYFEELEPFIDAKLGIDASVGGGSGIIPLFQKLKGRIEQAQCVVNGTIGYVLEQMSKGVSLHDASAKAIELGYAEPGAVPQDVIAAEMQDVVKKSVILSRLMGNPKITADDIKAPTTFSDLKGTEALVVEITEDMTKVSFQPASSLNMKLSGLQNGASVAVDGQQYSCSGPGAGVRVTAQTMIYNALKLNG